MDENYFHNEQPKPVAKALTLPVEQTERITIIDSIRGVALLGILLMNMPYFALPHQAGHNLAVYNEYSGANYYVYWIVNLVFEGTMRGLFSMLFGAGCLLLLVRLESRNSTLSAADVYYRRLLWLLVFGVINAFILLWPGDILYHYAICGLFLFPFRNLRARHLFIIGLLFLSVSMFKETLRWYAMDSVKDKGEKVMALPDQTNLTPEQMEAKQSWLGLQQNFNPDTIRVQADNTIKDMRGGYFSTMRLLSGVNAKFESSKFYASTFWDIISFLFIGMALFKWKVITGEQSTKFYLLLMLSCYIVGLSLNYWSLSTIIKNKFNYAFNADELYVNNYQIRRLIMTVGHLSLLVLLYKSHLLDWLMKMLARVGQMAFTNYLMQSIICGIIFYGYGFRWFGAMERYQIYIVVGCIWLFQIIFSNIWLSYFRFGPLEWVWRSLTYWKKQKIT